MKSSRLLTAAAAALALGSAAWTWSWSAHAALLETGEALYRGERPLEARLYRDADPLPAHASRCSNCHEGREAVGPALSAVTLTSLLPRRGGPASRFDEAALCRLLRDGVDPAQVLLAKTMPRYAIDDADCHALWTWLTR